MEDRLIDAWTRFCEILRGYGKAVSTLNPPCPAEMILAVEQRLQFDLPSSLKALLRLSNGQRLDQDGIFKSVSGWNVYRRQVFLDVESIPTAYERFLRDEVLVDEFGTDEIPFAVAGTPESHPEVFTIHRESQVVSLIWSDYRDPLMPAAWQVTRAPRGADLAEFLHRQIALFL